MPRHTVLRLGFHGAVFHLWAALEPDGVRGSTERDPPHVVADRALGFTHGLRHVKPVRLVPREPAAAGPPAAIRLAGTHAARHFGKST